MLPWKFKQNVIFTLPHWLNLSCCDHFIAYSFCLLEQSSFTKIKILSLIKLHITIMKSLFCFSSDFKRLPFAIFLWRIFGKIWHTNVTWSGSVCLHCLCQEIKSAVSYCLLLLNLTLNTAHELSSSITYIEMKFVICKPQLCLNPQAEFMNSYQYDSKVPFLISYLFVVLFKPFPFCW